MSVQSVAAKWKTTDGEEFSDQAAAVRHQAWVEARAAYEEACDNCNLLLAETARTATGKPFSLSQWTYYRVTRWWGGLPRLESVMFDTCNWQVRGPKDQVVITQLDDKTGRVYDYPISELYETEVLAEVALLAAMEEFITACCAERDRLRGKLGQ